VSAPLPKREGLPRTVYALGAVSLCTDAGSEMVLPLLPALLHSLGASMLLLGLLQGIGELIVAGLKLGSGIWSDRWSRRKPWLLIGYGLSTLVRPLFALATTPLAVVGLRSCDRIGKGLRAAPRDSLLADSAPAARRGAAFGVQRAMDHAGALLGALLAALLLGLGVPLRWVFALALLPGLVAMLVLWRMVQEVPRPPVPAGGVPGGGGGGAAGARVAAGRGAACPRPVTTATTRACTGNESGG